MLSALAVTAFFACFVGSVAEAEEPPMRIIVMHGAADWISVEGWIGKNSDSDLRAVLDSLGNRKLPIVLDSPGGSVTAALKMGEMIRAAHLSVAVGHTWHCSDPEAKCNSISAATSEWNGRVGPTQGVCYSACPFILAGGIRRMLSPYGYLGVHQIVQVQDEILTQDEFIYKTIHGKRHVVDRYVINSKPLSERRTPDLSEATRNKYADYFKKMGVDQSIVDMMMSAPPDKLRMISADEAMKIGLLTDQDSAYDFVAAGDCPAGQPIKTCRAAPPTQPMMHGNGQSTAEPDLSGKWMFDLMTPSTEQ
ncbi:hypothetical protein QA648_28340 (plasmid) [Rhizobium sp. CB3171]|uniref:COG3904 family protein n=1 Tax=Rhizobium sp. CB3171 TaxID=3039157 RepID=UPI0024B05138|nr:hypothetical protein [Rhizobium sp. CB3171]WFU04678.1 hypothetical protein QA648_28340 [Rhizobium sp. CB3171]